MYNTFTFTFTFTYTGMIDDGDGDGDAGTDFLGTLLNFEWCNYHPVEY